jgi:hypothetical protein
LSIKLQNQLNLFQVANDSQVNKFLGHAHEFLDYLIDNYGAFFIYQRSFALTDFLENAPQSIVSFVEEMQETVTLIPMKFSVLGSDAIDDHAYQSLVNHEFIYNRQDPSHRLISKSFRYLSVLDMLGMEMPLWKEEVVRRFNILSLLNYAFREC